jgi:hypothetical protein
VKRVKVQGGTLPQHVDDEWIVVDHDFNTIEEGKGRKVG